MITTTEISPAPALAPFVRCYTYREFDTRGQDMVKPWHAAHEITIPFFFKAKPAGLNNPYTGQIIGKGWKAGVTGLGTQYNGEMTFNGVYAFFEIVLKPNGFYKLFRIPAGEITNHVIAAEDIFNADFYRLYEQLGEATSLNQMSALADAYLLDCLKKQKYKMYKDGITEISTLILKQAGLINLKELAYSANMSKRNFQRQFSDQIGISPKLFCCITRFNHAFELKLRNIQKDWTQIAFECGYFDQTHLIKDFKKFAGNAPGLFLDQTPLTEEHYSSRVDI